MVLNVADDVKKLDIAEVLTEAIPDILMELPQRVSETLQNLPQRVQETLQDLPQVVPDTLQDLQERIQEINIEDYDIRPVPPAAASTCVYLFSFLVCLVFHRVVKRWAPSFVVPLALDFIKTLVACCYPFAHTLVRKNHGHFGYCIAMVGMAMLTQRFMSEGSPTPLNVWSIYLKRKCSLSMAFIRMLVQVLGAMCSSRVVMLVWYLELHPAHTHQLQSQAGGCFTDLNVPAYLGFLIECLGAALDTWLCMQVLSHLPFIDNLIKCISGAVMTVTGLGWTGMYVQPAMASSFTLGCAGTSITTHIIIYWGGTFLGTYLGIVFSQFKSLEPPTASTATMTDLHLRQDACQRMISNGHVRKPVEEDSACGGEGGKGGGQRKMRGNNQVKSKKSMCQENTVDHVVLSKSERKGKKNVRQRRAAADHSYSKSSMSVNGI